jgi:hypothetical protein
VKRKWDIERVSTALTLLTWRSANLFIFSFISDSIPAQGLVKDDNDGKWGLDQ